MTKKLFYLTILVASLVVGCSGEKDEYAETKELLNGMINLNLEYMSSLKLADEANDSAAVAKAMNTYIDSMTAFSESIMSDSDFESALREQSLEPTNQPPEVVELTEKFENTRNELFEATEVAFDYSSDADVVAAIQRFRTIGGKK